jgi:hypothetical protein
MGERASHRKRQHKQHTALCREHPAQLRSSAHRVQSTILYTRQFFIESILGFGSTQQYTLGMHLLLKALDHVLVGMFLVGGVGSAVVIVAVILSFSKDMEHLFSKDD